MKHSPDTKAQVMAALLTGQGIPEISRTLEVGESTIYEWAKELGGIDALRQGRLHDLLYTYVKENLTTLAAQSEHFRRLDWLERQDASSLAVLHGVVADKTVRILAAIERAQGPVDSG